MLVIQVMNNEEFVHCNEKYLVTERFVDENEIWDIPRLLFNNKSDAEFYVENSELSLMINTVKLLDCINGYYSQPIFWHVKKKRVDSDCLPAFLVD